MILYFDSISDEKLVSELIIQNYKFDSNSYILDIFEIKNPVL